jgi:N-acetylmuramoyl-L-alanine amidase
MPAILVEVGFISHPETEKKFKDLQYLELLANAIVAGLTEFLGLGKGEPEKIK